MIMSKDSDGPMQEIDKCKNLIKIEPCIVNLKKKLFKQILYGKGLLIENEYIQAGFNNLEKECEFVLYVQFKVECSDVWIQIENL